MKYKSKTQIYRFTKIILICNRWINILIITNICKKIIFKIKREITEKNKIMSLKGIIKY